MGVIKTIIVQQLCKLQFHECWGHSAKKPQVPKTTTRLVASWDGGRHGGGRSSGSDGRRQGRRRRPAPGRPDREGPTEINGSGIPRAPRRPPVPGALVPLCRRRPHRRPDLLGPRLQALHRRRRHQARHPDPRQLLLLPTPASRGSAGVGEEQEQGAAAEVDSENGDGVAAGAGHADKPQLPAADPEAAGDAGGGVGGGGRGGGGCRRQHESDFESERGLVAGTAAAESFVPHDGRKANQVNFARWTCIYFFQVNLFMVYQRKFLTVDSGGIHGCDVLVRLKKMLSSLLRCISVEFLVICIMMDF